MFMLRDYEIKRNEPQLFIAIIKLLLSVIVLYSAVQLIPAWMDVANARESLQQTIKFRVIANSSTVNDQQFKLQVVDAVQTYSEDHQILEFTVEQIEELQQLLTSQFPNTAIHVKSGDNLLPPKLQFGAFYPQNVWNSLVIVIGDGRGENWFCSVFPTVCDPSEEQQKRKLKFFLYEKYIEKSS